MDSPVKIKTRRRTTTRRTKSRLSSRPKSRVARRKLKGLDSFKRKLSRVSYRSRKTKSRLSTKSRKMKPKFTTKWQIEHQSLGIGPLKKGKLGGYHSYLDEKERKAYLNESIKTYGALSVFRSLNALAVYNKNSSPESSKIFVKDRNWVRDTYM